MTRKEVMCHQCIERVHCIDNRRIVIYNPELVNHISSNAKHNKEAARVSQGEGTI